MRQVPLGQTGMKVSALCLGTMTWGSQNTEAEGHAQADLAVEHGINFFDTAEMYPTNPIRSETVGRTEEIIGTWFKKTGQRDKVVLATKISGEGQMLIRGGEPITGAGLRAQAEASLRRLQTDYIDLYQLHWPNRGSYHFRKLWSYAPGKETRGEVSRHMLDVLHVAQELMEEGKVRAFGLSNESVWGAARWRHLAEVNGLPKMATVQNEYSLLCRQFDSDWAEFAVMEDFPLLAFSPLAAGLLSGKYAGDVTPEGSRRSINPDLSGRITSRAFPAVAAYLGIAARHGIDPCQMAIAFTMTRPFPVIPIIGARDMKQLATDIGAADLTLSPEVLEEIAEAHRQFPQPY